jgi:RimJ/RimL family protein N-acetyltransferase
MQAMIVRSRRLFLRHTTPEDVDVFFAMDRDPEVMRYIADGATTTDLEVTRAGVGRVIAAYGRRPGLGLWVCCLLDGLPVGWFALKPCLLSFPVPASSAGTPPPPAEQIEVGYRLLRSHWGQGYGTEMATELLRYGFDGLGLGRIIGACKAANLASSRVLVKAGLSYEGRGLYNTSLVDVYAAQRDAWNRSLGASTPG